MFRAVLRLLLALVTFFMACNYHSYARSILAAELECNG